MSLYPESGHLQCTSACPLWANSGHRGAHSITPLRDHRELSHVHRLSSSVNGVNRMLWRGAVYLDTIARDVGTRSFRRLRGLVLGGLNATMFGPSMGMRQPEAVQSWIN